VESTTSTDGSFCPTHRAISCWHCSHSMRSRVYVTVGCLSVCLSLCLSVCLLLNLSISLRENEVYLNPCFQTKVQFNVKLLQAAACCLYLSNCALVVVHFSSARTQKKPFPGPANSGCSQTARHRFVCLFVPSFDRSSGVRRVCC